MEPSGNNATLLEALLNEGIIVQFLAINENMESSPGCCAVKVTDGKNTYQALINRDKLNDIDIFAIVRLSDYSIYSISQKEKGLRIRDFQSLRNPGKEVPLPSRINVPQPGQIVEDSQLFETNVFSITPIKDISNTLSDFTIRARVVNKSPLRPYGKRNEKYFNVDLKDSTGRIMCSAFANNAKKFYNLIELGKEYIIRDCRVLPVHDKNSRRHDHEFELKMEGVTEITDCEPGIVNSKNMPRSLEDAIVLIQTDLPKNVKGPVSDGTGFLISNDGFIITCAHVVRAKDDPCPRDVRVNMNNMKKYKAKILAINEHLDVALLKIQDRDNLPTLELGDCSNIRCDGTLKVFAIGFPDTDCLANSPGVVTFPRYNNDQKFLATNIHFGYGMSGGPLLKGNGEVLGVMIGTKNKFSYALSVSELKTWLKKIDYPNLHAPVIMQYSVDAEMAQ